MSSKHALHFLDREYGLSSAVDLLHMGFYTFCKHCSLVLASLWTLTHRHRPTSFSPSDRDIGFFNLDSFWLTLENICQIVHVVMLTITMHNGIMKCLTFAFLGLELFFRCLESNILETFWKIWLNWWCTYILMQQLFFAVCTYCSRLHRPSISLKYITVHWLFSIPEETIIIGCYCKMVNMQHRQRFPFCT